MATVWVSPAAADDAPDLVAPISTMSVESATPSPHGWYSAWPLLRLVVNDDASGISEIHVFADAYTGPLFYPPPVFEPPVASYSRDVSLSGDGVHTIHYYAVDGAGNVEPMHELVVRIDTTAPAVVAIAWGADGPVYGSTSPPEMWTAGSFVDVHTNCLDSLYGNGSGCDAATSTVSIDGINRGTAPQTVSAEGRHSLTGSAQDLAGNATTAAPLTLAVDHSSPLVSITHVTATAHDVALSTQALDPALADGTAGSGLAYVWFDATNILTGESFRYVASRPATGTTWTAHTDLPNGAYSIRATATDNVNHQSIGASVTVAVVRAAV